MNARSKSILVVDDERGTVEVLAAVLGDAGYVVTGAHNGREALSALRKARPDLLVLDLVMPVLDGGQLLAAMRETKELAAVPVVMMSGLPESMVKRRCKDYQAFLRKPFALAELLDTVARALASAAAGPPAKKPRKRS